MNTNRKIKANSREGVALRTTPSFPWIDAVLVYLKNGTIVTIFSDDIVADFFGENLYVRVRLESGKEGYVLCDTLEAV